MKRETKEALNREAKVLVAAAVFAVAYEVFRILTQT